MATVVMDRRIADELRQARAVAAGSDRWDEIWEGTYMMAPLPNIEHQDLVGALVDRACAMSCLARDWNRTSRHEC